MLWSNPRLPPVQPWGCPRARDIFDTRRPSPPKTTCSFSYRFAENGPCSRQSGSQQYIEQSPTNFHGWSCSLIFRSRVGSLVSKKISSPRFSPGSCPKAPASPPVLFVNEYQKPPVLPRFSSQMPPVLPRFFWAPPVLPRFPPPVLPRFSPHSTPTVKISTHSSRRALCCKVSRSGKLSTTVPHTLKIPHDTVVTWLHLQSRGEMKLCADVWAVNNFWRSAGEKFLSGVRGASNLQTRFGSFFWILVRAIQTILRIDLRYFGSNFVLQTCHPITLGRFDECMTLRTQAPLAVES